MKASGEYKGFEEMLNGHWSIDDSHFRIASGAGFSRAGMSEAPPSMTIGN
jgi:hypothetical protein